MGGTQQNSATSNPQDAQQTALQVLAGMGGNDAQTQPAAQPSQTRNAQPQTSRTQPAAPSNSRVGTWVAKVGAEATVRLNLRADGSFTWTATRNGKTSDFQGQYRVDGGTLTLVRSDDKKLAGTITDKSNGFNFKLNGAKDSGLDFSRA